MKLIAFALFCLAFGTKLSAQESEDTCTFLTTITNANTMLYEKPKIAPNNEIRLMNLNEPVFVIGKTGKFAIVLEGFDAKYLLLENTQLTQAQINSLTPTHIDGKILQIDNSFTALNIEVAKEKDSLIKLGKMLYGLSKYAVVADTFTMTKGIKTKGCKLGISVRGNDPVKNVYVEIEGGNSIGDAEATKTVTCQLADGKKTGIFTFADLFNDKSNVIEHLTIKKITVELANNSKKDYSGSVLKNIVYPSPSVSLPPPDKPDF